MEIAPLTTVEAAEVCKVTPHTVAKWVRQGYIRPLKHLPGRGGYLFSVAEVARVAALPTRKPHGGGRPRKPRSAPQRDTLPDAS